MRISRTIEHLREHGDVRAEILGNRVRVELDGASGGRAFGRGIRQLKGLLAREVREPLDLKDLTAERVDLVLLRDGEESVLDGIVRDAVDEVPKRDSWLHLTREPNQDRFRHVEWHHTSGSREGNETRTGREGNTDWETSVRVTTSADSVWEKHSVDPGVDNAVSWTERDTTPVHDEVRQRMLGLNVNRFGVPV